MQPFLFGARINYTEGSFSISRPSDLSPRQLCVTISRYRVTQRIHYTLTPQNQLTSHNWDLSEDLICQALEMLIGFRVMRALFPPSRGFVYISYILLATAFMRDSLLCKFGDAKRLPTANHRSSTHTQGFVAEERLFMELSEARFIIGISRSAVQCYLHHLCGIIVHIKQTVDDIGITQLVGDQTILSHVILIPSQVEPPSWCKSLQQTQTAEDVGNTTVPKCVSKL